VLDVKSSGTDVLVLGAGVVGLTTAVRLAEAGLSVRVRTDQMPEETTSAAAGAILVPHLAHHPRMRPWRHESRVVFEHLAGEPGAGVRLVAGLEAARAKVSAPDWVTASEGFRKCRPDELRDGFACGWAYTAPLVDMPVYLRYLTAWLSRAGGEIDMNLDRVTSLDEVVGQAPIVVNCTGYGARDLVPDPEMKPVRGDLIVVDNPGIETFFEENGDSVDPIYILPQGEHLILGGTEVDGDANTEPDRETAEAILDRCAAVESKLKGLTIREHRVGVRPTRPQIRLEHVPSEPTHLIHNYGHGGAGVSLSWGCARDVLGLVRRL
jgi:D-amino-acid oxidase